MRNRNGWKSAARFLLCVAAWTVASPVLAAEKPVVNLSKNDWPPYFLDDGGFARDLLDLCLGEAGFTPRYRVVSIEQTYEGLRSGVVDLHTFSKRADRESFLAFGEEVLFSDNYQPIALAATAGKIKKLADLDGLRLGHLEGLRYTDEFLAYVHKRRDAGQLVVATSNEELLDLLLDGKIDVFVNLTSTALYIARQRDVSKRIGVAPLVVKGSEYFLAASKNSRRLGDPGPLLARVDECVRATKKDGRYRKIAEKYGLG